MLYDQIAARLARIHAHMLRRIPLVRAAIAIASTQWLRTQWAQVTFSSVFDKILIRHSINAHRFLFSRAISPYYKTVENIWRLDWGIAVVIKKKFQQAPALMNFHDNQINRKNNHRKKAFVK